MNGWRCPNCGSTRLRVRVLIWTQLTQTLDRDDGIDENEFCTELPTGDHEWNGDCKMDCNACSYEAKASDFSFSTPPKGTIPVINEHLVP